MTGAMDESERTGARLPNVAWVYDALLGGADNLAVDRLAARALTAAVPGAREGACANRAFLGRTVDYLAREAGISQFLDIGSGLPTRGQVHEIARAANPAARVVYSDNDPVVTAHARRLVGPDRQVEVAEGDVRYPGHLLTAREVRECLDFSRPVAVLMVAVLHFVPDDDRPWSCVRNLTERLAPGSYLVLSHVTSDFLPEDSARKAEAIYNAALVRGAARSRAGILRFFDGMELLDPPGLADAALWQPGRHIFRPRDPVLFWAGVARKPLPAGGN